MPVLLMVGGMPFAVRVAIAFGGGALIPRARRERKLDLEKINDVFE